MLKLEKRSNFAEVTIRMRECEGFFEPRLLKALAIALILHSGALLIFHVAPFDFSSTFTFPPVQVGSVQPSLGVTAFVSPYIEEEDVLSPPITLIPPLDWISFSQESTLAPSLPVDPHALQSLEERVWPKWQEPLSLELEVPRVQLFISGDLAEILLRESDPLLKEMMPSFPQSTPVYVTYQVQLDEKTGELFWYERTESSAVAAVDRLTEKILMNLRFAPVETKEIVTGILNFTILSHSKPKNGDFSLSER
jgi:hypothetical protein